MSGELVIGLGLFKSALDLLKTLKDVNDTAARQGIAIELGGKILAAQEQQASLIEQIDTLKAEITSFETWDAEKQRYELKPLGNAGVFAYSLKPAHENGEPPHWICPDCYQDRKKRILQMVIKVPGMARVLVCQNCGFSIYTSGVWQKDHGK